MRPANHRSREKTIYVVIEELVSESQIGGHADLATMRAMVGFTMMMILDVALE